MGTEFRPFVLAVTLHLIAVSAPLAGTSEPAVRPGAPDLFASPDWTEEGDQANALFGIRVANAGDVNGDGFDDLIVGATGYSNGEANEGAAFLYYGSPTGLASTAIWSFESDQAGARLGIVSGAGDVNGDGYDDVIVGAYLWDNTINEDGGRSYVFHGSASGLSATPDWTHTTGQAFAWQGWAVCGAGDLNADGYDDVAIGIRFYDSPEVSEGLVLVYHGSSSGLEDNAALILEGDQPGAEFGYAVAPAGDVNQDGYDDLLVGAPRYDNPQVDGGRAYCYYGSPTGIEAETAWYFWSSHIGARAGHSLSGAGDVDLDGYPDVIVGLPGYDSPTVDEGIALVFAGSPQGLPPALNYSWRAEGDLPGASFGSAVAGVGDVTGDGYDDVVVAAPDYDGAFTGGGRVFLYEGSVDGLAATAATTADGEHVDAAFGTAVSGSGRFSPFADTGVVVGSAGFTGPESEEGKTYHFELPDPDTITWTGDGDSTSWGMASNWDLARVPVSGDDVVIPDVTNTTEVAYTAGTIAVNTLESNEPLRISGGEITFVGSGFLHDELTLESGATISGGGDIVLDGLLTWTGGVMTGEGKTVANGGIEISGSDDKELRSGRVLRNTSSATWSGTGAIRHGEGPVGATPGTTLENALGAAFDIQNDAILEHVAGAPALFKNSGTLRKSLPGTGTTTIEADLVTVGTVEVQTGTLDLTAGFGSYSGNILLAGTFIVAGILRFNGADIETNAADVTLEGPSGTIVDESDSPAFSNFRENTGRFVANGVALESGENFKNTGEIVMGPSATWTITGSYTQDPEGATTLEAPTTRLEATSVLLNAGTVSGNGVVDTPSFAQSGGALRPGASPGTIEISGSFAQSPNGDYECEWEGRSPGSEYDQIDIAGNAELSGRLRILLGNGFVPSVGDTFLVLASPSVTDSFAVIEAFGLELRQETGSEGQRILVEEVNYREFVGPGSSWFAAENWNPPLVPDESSDVLLNDLVRIDQAGAVADEVWVRGGGMFRPDDGDSDRAAERGADSGWLQIEGGTLTLRELRIDPEARMDLTGAASTLIADRVTVEAGADIDWSSGTVRLTGAGDSLVVRAPLTIGTGPGVSLLELANGAAGALMGNTVLGAGGSTNAQLALTGGAKLEVEALDTGFSGTSTIQVENGSALVAGMGGLPGSISLGPNARLSGNGLVQGDLINGGACHPGGDGGPATLEILGNYVQSASGLLEIGLEGIDPGTYGALDVSGDANLDGTLVVNFEAGFFPAPGDSFRVVTSSVRLGEFAAATGDPVILNYDPVGVVLSVDPNSSGAEPTSLPLRFALGQNHPNPFSPTTTIRYDIPRSAPVSIRIYSVSGRLVRSLVEAGVHEPGRFEVDWDGTDEVGRSVGAGVYFCSLWSRSFEQTRTMVLLR
ncbi:MAG: FG-GAP repeat protein [Candidatus Eisenbacteria bacterium]|uniref:FG-GAP repeat protein n=1 Tax=Eiseniibacteriota bacterium TaxID=2212470 RepID=A0A956NDN6_UNCEI|nr:FG-GAP repeat protein [Candidatus Eisenbacteria bacterium]MCB9466580.1 FG-GAP repeat protein [Candidatus Eisenbacteria bacterium]